MKQICVKLESIKKLKPYIYLLEFKSPYIAKQAKPGQFLHIKIENKLTILRRPFSIHNIKGSSIYILFKVRGRGTEALSQFRKGDFLDIIGPLGNGFNLPKKEKINILVAGGIGIAPLLFLAKRLNKAQGIAVLGSKSKQEVICESEFRKLGYKVLMATEDGSRGFKGTAVGLLKNTLNKKCAMGNSNIYVCGPKEMFFEINKILKEHPKANCQVSFEQFMGCGLGICCTCSIETKNGYKKVCKDGPVFNIRDIW